jgi:hypothetical protein
MKPSKAAAIQAKAAQSVAENAAEMNVKLDLIMAKLGIQYPPVEAEVEVEATPEPEPTPEPIVEVIQEETPVEAEDKPAKKKK